MHFCIFAVTHCNTIAANLGNGEISKVVDLYNSETGAWSTAQLSVARTRLAATSVGNAAIFAGGWTGGALPLIEG